MEDLIIIAIIGGIVAVDTTVLGQFMLSQPIFSAAVSGFLLGDLKSGVEIGMIMQLIWLKQIPAGGTMFLNGNLGTMTATAALLLAGRSFGYSHSALLFNAVVFGLLISYLFGYFTQLKRRTNIFLVDRAGRSLDRADISGFSLYHLSGVLLTIGSGMIITVLVSLAGKYLLLGIPGFYYEKSGDFFQYGIYSFYGIGLGNVLIMVWDKKARYYPVTGLAFGVILALLI